MQENELQVVIDQNIGEIHFNFEELKGQLSMKMQEYENIEVSESGKKYAKYDLAQLRKLRESIEKRRKEVKADFMMPYENFEHKVRELTAIIDRPIGILNVKLKEIEEERIRQKKTEIASLWSDKAGEVFDFIHLEDIYNLKWNNAGTTMKAIEKEMLDILEHTARDMELILASDSDVMNDALDEYKKSRDLTKSLALINTYEANKKRALEKEEQRRKQEEEVRQRREIERAREEERKKLEEIEQAKKEERRKMELEKPDPDKLFLNAADEVDELPFVQPSTKTVLYKIVATPEEIEDVEMAFNSIGIYFERRES